MEKKIRNRILCGVMATTLAFSCVFSSCNLIPGLGNGDEDGDSYTITLNYNDNVSRDSKKYVDEGEAFAEPKDPTRAGYSFVGWATSATATADDIISFPYTPTGDVTLYAVWEAGKCTVTFDMNYSGSEAETVEVEYNQTVSAPETDPERSGYRFYGWYNKATGGTAVTFPYTVTEDVTFYANWLDENTNIYTVSFDYNHAEAPAEALTPLQVIEGMSFQKSATNTSLKREGYKFVGWGASAEATKEISYPYSPTENVTLYAIWQQEFYNINFMYNYVDSPNAGTVEKQQNVPGATMVVAPTTDPVRTGYTFEGWYTASLGGEKLDFAQGVKATKSLSYFAHWKSAAVETNIFQVEYTYFNPTTVFPGYSGSVQGPECVLDEAVPGLFVPTNDESNSVHTTDHGHFVSYLYNNQLTLTFEIYSTVAVSNVTLKASLSSEFADDLNLAPTGEHGYLFKVNGESLNYSITLPGATDGGKTPFEEYTVSTTVSLQAGLNKIELVTNNTTGMGGTMGAAAPMIDYIKLENTGAAKLTYHPIYDNLWFDKLV